MADLPKECVTPAFAFSHVGVDMAGPFVTHLSSSPQTRKTDSAYAAIFICFTTKAVHIELTSSLSTKSFLATLDQFIARRGCPSVIFSDNGRNFVGASSEISRLFCQDSVKQFLCDQGIQWKFIPPFAPHHGGLWESAVRSAKIHLRKSIGDQVLMFEELYTILVRIESVLNSRPLFLSDSDDLSQLAITPVYFLIGYPGQAVPLDETINQCTRLTK